MRYWKTKFNDKWQWQIVDVPLQAFNIDTIYNNFFIFWNIHIFDISSYQRLTGSELHAKFPQFETSDEYTAIYEPMAGLVDAAMGNAVHVQLARAHGATVIENCPVQRIERMSDGWIKVIIYNH